MPDTRDHPEVHQAYERLAAGYDRKGDTKPANAYLERPATRSLLPDETNDRILDAGLGQVTSPVNSPTVARALSDLT